MFTLFSWMQKKKILDQHIDCSHVLYLTSTTQIMTIASCRFNTMSSMPSGEHETKLNVIYVLLEHSNSRQ